MAGIIRVSRQRRNKAEFPDGSWQVGMGNRLGSAFRFISSVTVRTCSACGVEAGSIAALPAMGDLERLIMKEMKVMAVDSRYDYRASKSVTPLGQVVTPFSKHILSIAQNNMEIWGKVNVFSLLQWIPTEGASTTQLKILRQEDGMSGHNPPSPNALLKQYWLCSSICVAEVDGKLHWVSKSGLALSRVFPDLESKSEQMGFTHRLQDAHPTVAEIESRRFNVLQLQTSEAGYRLDETTIPAANKLYPYAFLYLFGDKLLRCLQENKAVAISYRKSRKIEKVVTSLNPAVLQTKFDRGQVMRSISPENWHRGRMDLGVIYLPDLYSGQLAPLPLHKVVHIGTPH